MNRDGWQSTREVSRLPIENRWDRPLLEAACGVPWSRHEGAVAVQNRSISFERSSPINIQIEKDPEAAGYTRDDDDENHGGEHVPVPGTPPMPPPWNPPPKDLKRKPEEQDVDDGAQVPDVRPELGAASSSQSGMKRGHEDGGDGNASHSKPRLTQAAVICSLMCYLKEEAEDKYSG